MDANTENQMARTPAKRARRKRVEQAALNEALAGKRCPACTTLGAWTVYDRERAKGRTRYVKCQACGHCDQVTIVIAERSDEKGNQAQG